MTTRIPARRLTVDHHGLHLTVVRRGRLHRKGMLTDSLIGESVVDLWLDGRHLRMPGSTTVELRTFAAA